MGNTAVFTGGGTAGHVTPNIALIQSLRSEGWHVHYIGTRDGYEYDLIAKEKDVPYHAISAGKLRRYFSLKTVGDMFRVVRGIGQSRKIIRAIRPDVLFSKGGYVSVPVVLGAKNLCPIVVHESDYSPGLSNRIAYRYADAVCTAFEDTLTQLGAKGVFTGTPIRPALFAGDAARGFAYTGLSPGKPVLMTMGGSQGAAAINDTLREALPALLQDFQIVHICGRGKVLEGLSQPGYVQYAYIDDALPDVLAIADIVLSRAGANAVFEFLTLQKPALLVPLPLASSRGDQLQNARYFEKRGYASILQQEQMDAASLTKALHSLYQNRARYIAAMQNAPHTDGTAAVLDVIRRTAKRHG